MATPSLDATPAQKGQKDKIEQYTTGLRQAVETGSVEKCKKLVDQVLSDASLDLNGSGQVVDIFTPQLFELPADTHKEVANYLLHKLQPRAGWYREQVTALQDRVAYQLKEEGALEEEKTEEEDTEEEETEEEEMTSRHKKEPCKAPKRPAGNVLDSGALVLKHPGKQSRASSKVFSSSSTCDHPLTGEYLEWQEFEAVIVKLVQDTCPVLGEPFDIANRQQVQRTCLLWHQDMQARANRIQTLRHQQPLHHQQQSD